LFQRHIPNAAIEIMSWVVLATTTAVQPARLPEISRHDAAAPESTRSIFDTGQARRIEVPVYQRAGLEIGAHVAGPAVIVESGTSTYVSPRFSAYVDTGGALVLNAKPQLNTKSG
jgi:N-methylhydantoinase A